MDIRTTSSRTEHEIYPIVRSRVEHPAMVSSTPMATYLLRFRRRWKLNYIYRMAAVSKPKSRRTNLISFWPTTCSRDIKIRWSTPSHSPRCFGATISGEDYKLTNRGPRRWCKEGHVPAGKCRARIRSRRLHRNCTRKKIMSCTRHTLFPNNFEQSSWLSLWVAHVIWRGNNSICIMATYVIWNWNFIEIIRETVAIRTVESTKTFIINWGRLVGVIIVV